MHRPAKGRRFTRLVVLLPLAVTVSARSQTLPTSVETIVAKSTPTAPLPVSPGQTVVTVHPSDFEDTANLSITSLLSTAPGVTEITGSGPRDTSISIRGSNDRQVGGIKNIVLFDDGFPITQPDGMSRADLVDPNAYVHVNVFEGPSSTLYGNYAVDGAIDLQTKPGSAIDGAEFGAEFGSYNTFENWIDAGGRFGNVEGAVFASNYRGFGFIANSRFDTSTENAIASYQVDPADRFTVKIINNNTDTQLPLRLSIDQFGINPYQQGCVSLQSLGCSSVKLFRNGVDGATVNVSPQDAGIGRSDRRTITGLRWDHSFDVGTSLRTQFVFDQRDIDQPTSSTSNLANIPALEATTTLTHRGALLGLPSTTLLGLDANGELIGSSFFNLTPRGSRAALVQNIDGTQFNIGGRLEERISVTPRLVTVLGLGGEVSGIDATDFNYAYAIAGGRSAHKVDAAALYGDLAPEAALLYSVSDQTVLHARVGTGYATPQFNQLFVNSTGQFANNTSLKSQSNVGVDGGITEAPTRNLTVSVIGFYEFFSNELVSQSPGASLQSFTFNAPASEHRGVEFSLDWSPLPRLVPGLSLMVEQLFDDQVYTNYTERLSSSTMSALFNRAGEHIPGVVPNNVDARVVYVVPQGRFAGLGGFLELNWRDAYVLDNANSVGAPASALLNLDLHYDPPPGLGALSHSRFFVEILNLADRVTVGSAAPLSDTLSTAGFENGAATLRASTGAILAGTPLSVFGGLKTLF